MELNLRGKTAIVTGASKGIGKAIAFGLAEEGCDLHIVSRTEADLQAVREEIAGKHQVSVTVHAMDLGDGQNARELIAACGDSDILVNNAGAIPGGTLTKIEEERWREAWDLKVFGYINLCREMYRRMAERKAGVIINVIGVGGEKPSAGYIVGSAGNASLMAFTRGLGGGSADDGIRVVGVNPGMIETERLLSLAGSMAGGTESEGWKKMMAGLPFGRPGKSEEVADLVTFLASERASYISGTIITIDAGAAHRN